MHVLVVLFLHSRLWSQNLSYVSGLLPVFWSSSSAWGWKMLPGYYPEPKPRHYKLGAVYFWVVLKLEALYYEALCPQRRHSGISAGG